MLERIGGENAARATTIARYDPGSRHTPFTKQGCTIYVKTGHLASM